MSVASPCTTSRARRMPFSLPPSAKAVRDLELILLFRFCLLSRLRFLRAPTPNKKNTTVSRVAFPGGNAHESLRNPSTYTYVHHTTTSPNISILYCRVRFMNISCLLFFCIGGVRATPTVVPGGAGAALAREEGAPTTESLVLQPTSDGGKLNPVLRREREEGCWGAGGSGAGESLRAPRRRLLTVGGS